ncbi:hypothetical protein FGRMN_8426 [Fusarium graminum]|nr:hypothetical protein FGRMN_8426 [Fusarium graminum]
MRYHAAWTCLTWLLLGLVQVAHSAQSDNILSHARERIWLWEMYSLFCDIEGASKQTMILGQNKEAKWASQKHVSLENPRGDKLTYAEFQADLMKKLTPIWVDKTLIAPGDQGIDKPTVAEAVDKLKSKGWAMPLDVSQVAGPGEDKNDYNGLISRVNSKFQAYYDSTDDNDKWRSRLVRTNQRTAKLSEDIVALRQQEADEWLLKQMTRDVDTATTPEKKKAYGLGLSRDDLVIVEETSTVDGATKWERVDIPETFLNLSGDRLKAFETKLTNAGIKDGIAGLIKWADNLGNQNFAGFGPGYSDQNESHFKVHATWKATMLGPMDIQQDQAKAVRGDAVPRLLEDRDSRAALVRGIRLHYHFAMSEAVTRLSTSMSLVARARNARRIMSNDIPEHMAADEQPYCIWYPDIATEDTYRLLASRFPDMRYQIGRACAAAGYHGLYRELDLLPEVSIAEEARESETQGGRVIYDEIMSSKSRYAVMDDSNRSIKLEGNECPAYLNGDTEVRWRLAARQSIIPQPCREYLPCIEEDMHFDLENQEIEKRYRTLTKDEAKLLYSPLPRDLPTVKKTVLTQMAAHDGNIERYARLANSARTLTPLDLECVVRGVLHHTMYARWWADQIKNNTIYATSAPYASEIQRAIMARRIMLNDASVCLQGWPSGVPMPFVIWWPLKPEPDMLELLAENVPEMRMPCAAAAIACNYLSIYRSLDPEPSYPLWKVASECSVNSFYREDQERRGKEKNVDVEDETYMESYIRGLARTRESTVLDEDDQKVPDCVEMREHVTQMHEVSVLSTSLVQVRVWTDIGKSQ